MNYKTKSKIKTVVLVIVILGILATAVAGVVALSKKETKTISSFSFSRGALDENGEYIASEQSIYTKEAIDCNGLRIVPDFEAKMTYDVYFYTKDDVFMEAEKGLKGVYDDEGEGPSEMYAKARIVIHPEIPEDVKTEDFKIKAVDIFGYANGLVITVDKEQHGGFLSDSKLPGDEI